MTLGVVQLQAQQTGHTDIQTGQHAVKVAARRQVPRVFGEYLPQNGGVFVMRHRAMV